MWKKFKQYFSLAKRPVGLNSKDWSDKQRLAMIQLLTNIPLEPDNRYNLRCWVDINERVQMVATQSSGFLEANRPRIFEDVVVPEVVK